MALIKGKGSVAEYQGKKLDKPIEYEYEYEDYDNSPEKIKAAGEWPNDKDITAMVVRKNQASANSVKRAKATEDLKTAYEGTDEYKIGQLVKSIQLMHPNMSASDAQALAESISKQ